MTQQQARTLLAIYAHPDDEAGSGGGTLAQYAADGVNVALVCATRGEVGEIAEETLATPETLPQVREQELRNAANALGVGEVIFLDYRDSGMAGTDDNENPAALVNASEDDVVSQLVGVIRRLKPQVIMTFDPTGWYGHPDHVAMHKHAVSAFHAAADADRFPEQGAAWSTSRLVYPVWMKSRFIDMRDRLQGMGIDASRFDRFDQEGIGWLDDDIHVIMDVSATVDAKWKALNCHQTQFGTFHIYQMMPEDMVMEFLSTETYALGYPEPSPSMRLSDLFEGI